MKFHTIITWCYNCRKLTKHRRICPIGKWYCMECEKEKKHDM